MRKFSIAAIKSAANFRPEGYFEEVISSGIVSDDSILLSDDEFNRLRGKFSKPIARFPAWASIVALAKSENDSGIGDTIARTIGPIGGNAYKRWFKSTFGKSCGCKERQEDLNKQFPYTG